MQPATEKDAQWSKTQCANLTRYVPSGKYFARIRIRGKLILQGKRIKVPNNLPYMNPICSLLLAGIVFVCDQLAWGEMYLQGSGGDHAMSATHDRYYSGTNNAFIGGSLDFSGVSSGPPWATMISAQYFITAYHSPANSQSTLIFHEGNDANSGAHAYSVDTNFHFTTSFGGQPSDVYLGRLTAPIPAADHIAFYPVLSLPNFSNYVGMTIYNYGNPDRLGRNLISRIEPYAEGGENQLGMFFNYDVPGLGADETYLISGDSGGPSFAIVNGKPALLGEHFSTYGTSGMIPFDGGPPKAGDGSWWSVDGFIPAYISQLNSVLPPDQQITLAFGPDTMVLTITNSSDSVTVSWPLASDGFTLQQNNNPANPAGWSTYSGQVSTNNGVNSITITSPTGQQFYRLFHP